jgi:Domain of unknown function (DUF4340)
MKRLWLLNLALLAVIATLGAIAFLRPGQPPAPAPLTALTGADVTQLRVTRAGQPELRLSRHGDSWRVDAPVAARANAFNVEALLRIASLTAEPLAAAGQPAEYGLKDPQARLWLNDDEIAFGAFHPLNDRQYLLYRGAVYLASSNAFGAVARPWTDYLDTHLLGPQQRLRRLQLPGFSLAFEDGTWVRTPPDKALSGDAINDFVAQWQNASALAVDRYSGRPPIARVVLQFADDPKPLQIGVIARQPEFVLYRKDEGIEYRFPEEVGKHLLTLSSK